MKTEPTSLSKFLIYIFNFYKRHFVLVLSIAVIGIALGWCLDHFKDSRPYYKSSYIGIVKNTSSQLIMQKYKILSSALQNNELEEISERTNIPIEDFKHMRKLIPIKVKKFNLSNEDRFNEREVEFFQQLNLYYYDELKKCEQTLKNYLLHDSLLINEFPKMEIVDISPFLDSKTPENSPHLYLNLSVVISLIFGSLIGFFVDELMPNKK